MLTVLGLSPGFVILFMVFGFAEVSFMDNFLVQGCQIAFSKRFQIGPQKGSKSEIVPNMKNDSGALF